MKFAALIGLIVACLIATAWANQGATATRSEEAFAFVDSPPVCVVATTINVCCQGEKTLVPVDASASFDPDGGAVRFAWASCATSTLSSIDEPIVMLTMDTSQGCARTCNIRLRVRDTDANKSQCVITVNVIDCTGLEGCSHGYWKNHHSAWEGYSPSDDFDTTFGTDLFTPDITLDDALRQGGGRVNNLGRQAVAALLDAAKTGVNFPLTELQVIQLVQIAEISNTKQAYGDLAEHFDALVNLGCPL